MVALVIVFHQERANGGGGKGDSPSTRPRRVILYNGRGALPGGIGSLFENVRPSAGNPQYRPGQLVHRGGVDRAAGESGCARQHGWPGPLDGKCLHRSAVARREVRMPLSLRPHRPHRPAGGTLQMACQLQRLAPAPASWEPHPVPYLRRPHAVARSDSPHPSGRRTVPAPTSFNGPILAGPPPPGTPEPLPSIPLLDNLP